MTKSHYGFSFIISVAIYATLGFFLLAFLEVPKKIPKKPREKVIKIAAITPKPKAIVPPIVMPKPPVVVPPKEIVKPKPKKVVKKVIKKPKPKKIIKKVKPKPKPKPKPKKIIKKKEPVIEPIIEEEYFTEAPKEVVKYVEPQIIQAPTPPKPAPKAEVDKSAEKRAFLSKVRHAIYSNKKYPKMAKRRGIQGSVQATFDITSNGEVSNIQLSGGSIVLQKAVRKSILKSFPFSIPNELRGKFPMYNVSVNVGFVLE